MTTAFEDVRGTVLRKRGISSFLFFTLLATQRLYEPWLFLKCLFAQSHD